MQNLVKRLIVSTIIAVIAISHTSASASQIGPVTSAPTVKGNEVLFKCTNAQVKLTFCGQDIVKVWCDEDSVFKRTDPGWFSTGSFAVENEALGGPSTSTVTDKVDYYEMTTDNLSVRVAKSPFALSFYDKSGVLLSADYGSTIGTSTSIKCRWEDQGIRFLADEGGKVMYSTDGTSDASQWIVTFKNDSCTIKNKKTGNYVNIENGLDYVECSAMSTIAPSAWWVRESADSYVRLRNATSASNYLQVESSKGYAQCAAIQSTWYSAQWTVSILGGAGGFSWDNATGEKTCVKQMQTGENFFGLGQSRKGFNKTGKSVTNWNRDLLGTGEPWNLDVTTAGNYYTSHPFVISTKGYGLFFDNTSRTKFDLGETNPSSWSFGTKSPAAAGQMIYYFIYGPSMKNVVTRYTDLTGKTFFPPRWALGHMQSHWGYTQSDIERIAKQYREKSIPCDAMIADIEWYGCYCTPSAWNTGNFPNGPQMITDLHKSGYKFLRIDDPNVSDHENGCGTTYNDGESKKYFVQNASGQTSKVNWPWGGSSGIVDFFNKDASAWWSSLQVPRLAEGLDGMWCDMNEPAVCNADMRFFSSPNTLLGGLAELHNAYALAHVRSNFLGMRGYFDSTAKTNKRTFMLCRAGYSGQQKYSLNWSGDITRNWDWLSSQVYQGMSAGISGYTLWAHDVGGFTGNPGSNELEARWFEFGALSPVSRIHYEKSNNDYKQEPWEFNTEVESIARKYIQLRYRLIPYLYSEVAQSIVFKSGIPLMRPLILEYQDDLATYNLVDQYLLGSSILVAPVVTSGTSRSLYLPAGTWIDYWDGTAHTGPKTISSYSAPLDKVPLFIKGGSIIPQAPLMSFDGEKPLDPLTIEAYPQGSTSFTLYEDDGTTTGYQQNNYSTTKISCSGSMNGGGTSLFVSESQGTFTGKLTERSYNIVFHYQNKPDSVLLNNIVITSVVDTTALAQVTQGWCWLANDRKGTVRIKTPKIKTDAGFSVSINQVATGTLLSSEKMKAFGTVNVSYRAGKVIGKFGQGFSGDFSIAVYGIDGKRVAVHQKSLKQGGLVELWNCRNSANATVGSGHYLVELTCDKVKILRKCIVR